MDHVNPYPKVCITFPNISILWGVEFDSVLEWVETKFDYVMNEHLASGLSSCETK